MCLAIVKTANSPVKDEHLHSGWIANPDGAGFAYVRSKKVVVEKGFTTYKEFLAAFHKAQERNKKSNFLIHFRIRSLGSRTPDNTHPYEFKHGALIHNGTLNGTGAAYDNGPSDTKIFTETFGDKLTFSNIKEHKADIERIIGFNKIATLYHDGSYMILNEKSGQWVDGVWFSNGTYRPYNRTHGGYSYD